jgi:hypothetical protein
MIDAAIMAAVGIRARCLLHNAPLVSFLAASMT